MTGVKHHPRILLPLNPRFARRKMVCWIFAALISVSLQIAEIRAAEPVAAADPVVTAPPAPRTLALLPKELAALSPDKFTEACQESADRLERIFSWHEVEGDLPQSVKKGFYGMPLFDPSTTDKELIPNFVNRLDKWRANALDSTPPNPKTLFEAERERFRQAAKEYDLETQRLGLRNDVARADEFKRKDFIADHGPLDALYVRWAGSRKPGRPLCRFFEEKDRANARLRQLSRNRP